MKSRIKEQGSTAHIVIIVVLVIAVLGLLGFVFWQNFINKPATTTTPETSTVSETKSDGKTLTITEWGVKGEYSDISEVGYNFSGGGTSTLFLTTPGYPESCGPSSGGGSIQRLLATDPLPSPFPSSDDPTVEEYYTAHPDQTRAHLGDYYYIYTGANAPCEPGTNTVQDQLKAATKQIIESLKAV